MTDTSTQTTTVYIDNANTTQVPAGIIASDELSKTGIVSNKIVDASQDVKKAACQTNPEQCAAAEIQADDASEVADILTVQEELKPSSIIATNLQPDLMTKPEPQTKSMKRAFDQITKPAADEISIEQEKPASVT